jgi:ribonuclease-3
LEFLGDAVLGLAVTDRIYREHGDVDEGVLTEIRKSVVSSVALAGVAEAFDIGPHLLLGKGEEQSGGRLKPSILADAVEAIIGTTYIHLGYEEACTLVDRLLADRLVDAREAGADHKSRLQELVAQRFGSTPRYRTEASGPDHARTFFVTVLIDGSPAGQGVGRSKKQAEQAAAREAWRRFVPASPSQVGAPAHDTEETVDG